jgi:hypothetical protein
MPTSRVEPGAPAFAPRHMPGRYTTAGRARSRSIREVHHRAQWGCFSLCSWETQPRIPNRPAPPAATMWRLKGYCFQTEIHSGEGGLTLGRLSDGLVRRLLASGMIGALVFMGTIIYCADRLGWAVAIAIGWAPALVMAIISMVGYAAVSAMVAVRSGWISFRRVHAPVAHTSAA